MRRRNRERGFTLIELLIVVTIILIIAAFTIPKLTKSTIPAHEASAIASIKAINEAEMIYASSHPDVGFTVDLATLGGTAQGGGEQTIDNNLASGRKSGYSFTYTAGEKVNAEVQRTPRDWGMCMEMTNLDALKTYDAHPYHKEWTAAYEKVRVDGTTTFNFIAQ